VPDLLEETDDASLAVCIAGVDATIRGPHSVVAVLERTLVHAHRSRGEAHERTSIRITKDDFVWQISGRSARSMKALSASSVEPQVAGAVVSALISDASEAAGLCVWRAAVVERDGEAVAFVGDDWESALVLAAHLQARGWRLLGGDYALIDRSTLTALELESCCT